ncbi:hypothetical protein AVEN_231055-1 [Araneus ventricosus]|uniref:Uncharacterized protein n=1 Tax=Araneus ventricosus TaxID=182803 RepID=A0A4Y2A2U9_ARAVE|nr:hypothetical protein AVEN_231055-1 [Araneus ventricosus]
MLFDCDSQNYGVVKRERREKRSPYGLNASLCCGAGAPLKKISNVKPYLMETFQNEVIWYGGFIEWSPRSPDSTTLDFLWGGICDPSANIAGSSTTHY